MKTKTYILTLSTHFPKGHPREGEFTDFRQAVENALTLPRRGDAPWKRHTIRAKYDLWKHRIDEVNAGRAVLSVRQWLGAPRRSKQRELFRFDRDSGIGVEELWFGDGLCHIHNGRSYDAIPNAVVAENDGLTLEDWLAWFRDCDKAEPMAIIHFTKFRYCK